MARRSSAATEAWFKKRLLEAGAFYQDGCVRISIVARSISSTERPDTLTQTPAPSARSSLLTGGGPYIDADPSALSSIELADRGRTIH
jgi:hypothetical protein